jgi:hypothetical protein
MRIYGNISGSRYEDAVESDYAVRGLVDHKPHFVTPAIPLSADRLCHQKALFVELGIAQRLIAATYSFPVRVHLGRLNEEMMEKIRVHCIPFSDTMPFKAPGTWR